MVNSESSNSMEQANSAEMQNKSTKIIRLYSNFKDGPVSECKLYRPNTGNDSIACVESKIVQIKDTYPSSTDSQKSTIQNVTGLVFEVFDTGTGQPYEVP
ncbi:Uncharacterised protein [Rothia dentocariosa]|nr:Uncharacterised protein [Rothia dentocariosa]